MGGAISLFLFSSPFSHGGYRHELPVAAACIFEYKRKGREHALASVVCLGWMAVAIHRREK
jgi:hypothetical protein